MRRLSLLLCLLGLTLPAAAAALPRANPADRLAGVPIEASTYDPATHCAPRARPGMLALQRWLQANVRGAFWGSYRCEKWGRHQASLTPRTVRSTGTSTSAAPPTGAPRRG